MIAVEDTKLPKFVGFKSPNETPEQEMQPFKIYEDDPASGIGDACLPCSDLAGIRIPL